MTDLKTMFDIVDALGTPVLAFIAWVVYRIKMNDLPHIQERLDEMSERISHIEGVKAGVELERMKGNK